MAASSDEESAPTSGTSSAIDTSRHRFPFCIVWTPIPLITWLFPFIGHMGIATGKGVIRDFAGPYFVSKDQMGFGWPTRFWQLDPAKASGGVDGWDHAVTDASEEYKSHMHNLFCDNCHSHVALTLNLMNYDGSNSWNMVKLAALIFFKGRVTGCGGWLKQWLPFLILMVRLSVEMLNNAPQYINTLNDRELQLRNYKIPVIENMGATRDSFDTIDMTDNDIKKLDNFPVLKRLRHLHLHNNRVQYIDPKLGEHLPNLKTLTLTNNNLCELGDIDPLISCPNLEYVSFIGNPITHKEHYRAYVIFRLPQIRILDFKRERQSAAKIFKGKKNAKLRGEIGKKSRVVVEEEAAAETATAPRGGSVLTEDDRARIQEAIANAKTVAEVDYLQAILQSGRIPDRGWNRQLDFGDKENQNQNGNPEQFQPEVEEAEKNAEEMET